MAGNVVIVLQDLIDQGVVKERAELPLPLTLRAPISYAIIASLLKSLSLVFKKVIFERQLDGKIWST